MRAGAVLAALVGMAPGSARANGRFPTAGFLVVGPGAASDVTALRTTFGIVVSTDHGHTWSWICEGAYNAAGTYDPPLAISDTSALLVGLPGSGDASGVMESVGFCTWTHPTGDPGYQVADIAWDPTGTTVVLGVSAYVGMMESDGLSVSTDGGHSFVTGARIPSFFLETVEVAPSNPRRIYVSGYGLGGVPTLYRSDDGGRSLVLTTMNFTSPTVSGVFVSGVDPHNPDVVYIRANDGLGTRLIRSDDGGMSFHQLTQTMVEMRGFALSDDGQTVWVGSSSRTEGILRSVAGGPFARVLANTTVNCMRYHGGLLYICGDDSVDGYALGFSTDGGDHIEPLMSLRDVVGPVPTCGPGSVVHDVCGPQWPAQQTLLRNLDAAPEAPHMYYDAGNDLAVTTADGTDDGTDGTTDAATVGVTDATDASVAVPDAGSQDTGTPGMDVWYPDVAVIHHPSPTPAPVASSGCGCTVAGSDPRNPRPAACGWMIALGISWARRRAGRQPRGQSPGRDRAT